MDEFGDEIRELLKLDKLRRKGDSIELMTENSFDTSLYLKFLYDQEYLNKLGELMHQQT